ncbi:MAG: ImmA/IrrE family metallo-endopeptidase [Candidatus Sumerlaeia bacterium]|nr:ImmA/IrrE family metallo-endopeptidase [Candidatus Sumerlaeia bacterium]
MSITTLNMQTLRGRLSEIGVTRKYLDEMVLPEWWDDRIADDPSGLSEAQGLIGKALGLRRGWLAGVEDDPFRHFGPTKFKAPQNVTPEQLGWAKTISARIAEIAAHAMRELPIHLPISPSELRATLLETNKYVTLENLVETCWQLNIPVLHVGTFPDGRKPDGLAAFINNRPVIVLNRNESSTSWMGFILAHELGHICLGHLNVVNGTGLLVEDSMENIHLDDEDEIAANKFACEILTGEQDPILCVKQRISVNGLVRHSMELGETRAIAPGVIALNHGKQNNRWGAARSALKIIEGNTDAISIIHGAMIQHLDMSQLPDETVDYLFRMTGAELAE